jgi:hypothetical protein
MKGDKYGFSNLLLDLSFCNVDLELFATYYEIEILIGFPH